MDITQLTPEEYTPYFKRYFDKVPPSLDLRDGFQTSMITTLDFFRDLSHEKWDYRYGPDKWTIKEVLQHLIDTERIFMYRCFRLARKDDTSLASFDQDIYIGPSRADQKETDRLLWEYRMERERSITLLKSITDQDLCFIGDISGHPMSARAAAFLVIGHEIWHMEIIRDKYL